VLNGARLPCDRFVPSVSVGECIKSELYLHLSFFFYPPVTGISFGVQNLLRRPCRFSRRQLIANVDTPLFHMSVREAELLPSTLCRVRCLAGVIGSHSLTFVFSSLFNFLCKDSDKFGQDLLTVCVPLEL